MQQVIGLDQSLPPKFVVGYFKIFAESFFVWTNDIFPDIFYTIPHAPHAGWIYTDIGLRYCWRILAKQKYFTIDLKEVEKQVAPWVFANPRPHDEEHAGPDQGELDEEGVEVGGRLCDDVPHQVDSTACEVVKLFHWGHLEAKHYHLYLQII